LSDTESVLDACSLLAFFQNEPGAEKVESLLKSAQRDEIQLYLHKINFLEVYYKVMQKDAAKAKLIYDTILHLPILIRTDISDEVFEEAARLKVRYKVSLADSIALAVASINQMTLVTCDHNELDRVDESENIKFEWIRPRNKGLIAKAGKK
jgi:predicted nucleic acid-binding protein